MRHVEKAGQLIETDQIKLSFLSLHTLVLCTTHPIVDVDCYWLMLIIHSFTSEMRLYHKVLLFVLLWPHDHLQPKLLRTQITKYSDGIICVLSHESHEEYHVLVIHEVYGAKFCYVSHYQQINTGNIINIYTNN